MNFPFQDEADILSDSVAIIHKGALLCQGSPLLLKSKFGCGYQLTISRFGDSNSNNSSFKNSNTDEHIKILVTDYDKENCDEETGLDQLNVTDSDSGRVSNNSVHLINTGKREELNCSENHSEASAGSGKLSDKLMQFIQVSFFPQKKLEKPTFSPRLTQRFTCSVSYRTP